MLSKLLQTENGEKNDAPKNIVTLRHNRHFILLQFLPLPRVTQHRVQIYAELSIILPNGRSGNHRGVGLCHIKPGELPGGKGGNGHAKTGNILIQQPHNLCHGSAIIRQDCMSFTVHFSTVLIIIHLRPRGLWTLVRTLVSHVGYHCCQKLSSFQCQIQRKQFINSEKFNTSCLCF